MQKQELQEILAKKAEQMPKEHNTMSIDEQIQNIYGDILAQVSDPIERANLEAQIRHYLQQQRQAEAKKEAKAMEKANEPMKKANNEISSKIDEIQTTSSKIGKGFDTFHFQKKKTYIDDIEQNKDISLYEISKAKEQKQELKTAPKKLSMAEQIAEGLKFSSRAKENIPEMPMTKYRQEIETEQAKTMQKAQEPFQKVKTNTQNFQANEKYITDRKKFYEKKAMKKAELEQEQKIKREKENEKRKKDNEVGIAGF